MNQRREEKHHYITLFLQPEVKNVRFVLAYTPGVAEPCFRNQKMSIMYKYTAKGNLVVITNGTAVLGFEILVLKLQSL
jgi:malic enzyme